MPRLIWSPSALDDFRRIDIYLSEHDGLAAVRIIRAIRRAAERLQDFPRLGPAIATPFRVITVRSTPYLLIYRLREGDVEIVRIRHGRENWLDSPEGLP